MKDLGRAGVVGRFKPLHLGATLLLETLCKRAEHVVIGIGSCNKYNMRNPFTADESEGMVHALLKPKYNNYSILHVPDFAHIPEYSDGKMWKKYIVEHYGRLDNFVSGNEYVARLLADNYHVIHPGDVIPAEGRIRLKASEVRIEMARYGNWEALVSKEVADYMKRENLVERFRKEFGLQTLACLADDSWKMPESAEAEKAHTCEG